MKISTAELSEAQRMWNPPTCCVPASGLARTKITIDVPDEDAVKMLAFYRSQKEASEKYASYCDEIIKHIESALQPTENVKP